MQEKRVDDDHRNVTISTKVGALNILFTFIFVRPIYI